MVSDPPTPTKNDMILFSGVLEVACQGSRSRLCDDTDCKLCNNDQETPVQLARIVHSQGGLGHFKAVVQLVGFGFS